ncbi:hypothetical protein EVAR_72228_1 [Eumeta japonica]|uniref:Uncharacterized protein n=1 Tax=Eumeta variegata TaxID=151549 RepID=A0A4C1TB99_EUMVA|nr:hypothetical protein EVAR_72228_1 [Eumeta japonica]
MQSTPPPNVNTTTVGTANNWPQQLPQQVHKIFKIKTCYFAITTICFTASGCPVTENPPETALMPPQTFQNVEDFNVLQLKEIRFKRSGVARHHRATAFVSSASGQEPTAFNMPPPPPADFANTVAAAAVEPDNNELPLQENQEVLTPATTQMTLAKPIDNHQQLQLQLQLKRPSTT